MLVFVLIILIAGVCGFSLLVGHEVVDTRLANAMPSGEAVGVVPIDARLLAGAGPVLVSLLVATIACVVLARTQERWTARRTLIATFMALQLVLALYLRGLESWEALRTLIAPMLLAAALVPFVVVEALTFRKGLPTRPQLIQRRRVAAAALVAAALFVVWFADPPLLRWLTLPLFLGAWFAFGAAATPANDRDLRRVVVRGGLLVWAVLMVFVDHRWEAYVLIAVVALGLATLLVAREFADWEVPARVVVLSAVLVGGLAGVAAAHEDATPVRPLVALTPDGNLTCGIHVASTGDREYYVEIGGGTRRLASLPREGLLAVIGGATGLEAWRQTARAFAADVLAQAPRRFGMRRDEFCQPDRPPDPTPSEGLAIAQRYQPDLSLDSQDEFWPVSVLTTFGLRDGDARTCVDARASSCDEIGDGLPWSSGEGDWLEFPSRNEVRRQHRAMVAFIGSDEPKRSALQYYLVSRDGPAGPWNVQYWSFYVYNYQPGTSGGTHEGDFEVVGLVLSASREPRYVWMARHGNEGRPFAFDEPLFEGENHVDVKVARGSHASYEACGEHPREAGADHVDCAGHELRPQLSDLALAPWACWRGFFGHRSLIKQPVFADGPQGPLWQQRFGGHEARPCKAVSDDPGRKPDRDEAKPDDAAQPLRDAAGLLSWWFDDCADWQKPPATGTYVVACDENALRRFFDSGLDDDSAATVQITGTGREPEGPMVPAVWRARNGNHFERLVISATGATRPAVYAVCQDDDGRRLQVSFAAVPMRATETARIDDKDPSLWRLRATDGTPLAEARPVEVRQRLDGRQKPGPVVSGRCRR
jgi:hypothetical protein